MNADDVLKYGHQTVQDTLQGLEYRHWDTPDVCGVWSVREIIAHLSSFEQMLIAVLDSLLDGPPSTSLLDSFKSDPLRFNDEQVAQRATMSPRAVLEEYEAGQQQARLLLSDISPERRRKPGILPWYGAEYDLEDILAYSFYGHKREHCAQINVFRDLLQNQENKQ